MTRTKAPPVILSAEDLAHVQCCLHLLQRAQTLVDSAAQALCPVPGFGNQWSRLGTPYAAVRRAWHQVEARRCELQSRPPAGG